MRPIFQDPTSDGELKDEGRINPAKRENQESRARSEFSLLVKSQVICIRFMLISFASEGSEQAVGFSQRIKGSK